MLNLIQSREPWLIHPPFLHLIEGLSETAATEDAVLAAFGSSQPQATSADRTGIVNIVGVITRGSSWAGSTIGEIRSTFQDALQRPEIERILLYVDSPGGTASGIADLADEIYDGRRQKPITAFISGLGASAAYWLATAAERVVASRDAMVGSVGVVFPHVEYAKYFEAAGIKHTLIAAGRLKTAGNSVEPLSAEAKAEIQTLVDHIYSDFVGSLAKHRGTNANQVRERFGEGAVLIPPAALERGMIDGISTLSQVLSEPTISRPTAKQHGIAELRLRKARLRLAARHT